MPIDNAPISETPLTSPQEFYPRTSQNESTLSLEKIRILGKDAVCLGVLLALYAKEDLALFLGTHPVPVFVINTVNGFLGYGLDTPAASTGFGRDVEIVSEDRTHSY